MTKFSTTTFAHAPAAQSNAQQSAQVANARRTELAAAMTHRRSSQVPPQTKATHQLQQPTLSDSAVTAATSAPDAGHVIARSAFTYGEVLASGNFGVVFRGRYGGADVAVKQLLGDFDAKVREDAIREASMMRRIPPHPHVVLFYGICVDGDRLLILTDLCDGGDLRSYVQKHHDIPNAALFDLCLQVAAGMAHLHSLQPTMLHRDLAARNVLLLQRGSRLLAQVADFGMSRTLQSGANHYSVQHSVPFRWTAPEVLSSRQALPASDVWSFGVLAWEAFSFGALPYGNLPDHAAVVAAIVRDRRRLACPERLSTSQWQVFDSCLAYDPHARPDFVALGRSMDARRTNY